MRLRLVLVFFVSLAALRADVSLAPLFTDHAVFQQGKPIPVWGSASPGEKVSVTFDGETASTQAGTDGRWLVNMKARPASGVPAELKITGRNQITLADIVVGEVWLASGQSNMEFRVCDIDPRTLAREKSEAKFPLIRHIKIERASSGTPQTSAKGAWVSAVDEGVANFTAVGYYFARELHEKLQVPVGIINSSYGGTAIECWLSPAAFAADPSLDVVKKRWAKTIEAYPKLKPAYDQALVEWQARRDAAKAKGEKFPERAPKEPSGPDSVAGPSNLFNAMVHPLLPAPFRGVIWYQGEANVSRHAEYHALFAAHIAGWRRTFNQPDLPFYWVQLANCAVRAPDATPWAFLREAQDKRLALPATGQAVTIDIGDPDNIHPRNKRDVGRRLSFIALAKTYGKPVAFENPRLAKAEPAGAAIRVTLVHADGLKTRDGAAPLGFKIAGADQNFVPAQAVIEPAGTLLVSAPSVANPVAVRYAWSNAPDTNLYNAAGLPVAPFRSDTWPAK